MAQDAKLQVSPVPKVIVDFPGRDRLEAHGDGDQTQVVVHGCRQLQEKIKELVSSQKDPTKWVLPQGNSHHELMIREMVLRLRGEWDSPYKDEEICHCRSVPTSIVDQAILNGAHTCARVSSRTSASTSCGTCRTDVQKLIDYRLKVG